METLKKITIWKGVKGLFMEGFDCYEKSCSRCSSKNLFDTDVLSFTGLVKCHFCGHEIHLETQQDSQKMLTLKKLLR